MPKPTFIESANESIWIIFYETEKQSLIRNTYNNDHNISSIAQSFKQKNIWMIA